MQKIIEKIVDHPWVVIGTVILITIGFLISIPNISVETDFTEYLSEDDPAVAAADRADDRYGSQTLIQVAVETDGTIFKTSTLKKMEEMNSKFEDIMGVDDVTGPLTAQIITGEEKSITVGPAAPSEEVPSTPEAMEEYKKRVLGDRTVKDRYITSDGKAGAISIKLKEDANDTKVAEQVVDIVSNYRGPERIYISGLPYMNSVLSQSMGKDLRLLLPLVILVIIVVLYLSFRSLRGVLLPLLVVSLSTIWAIGAMALLDIPLTILSFILPIILMAIGIAYCIHVLNKYYEEISQGKSRKEAVVETTTMMLSPVSMAGLTTAAGFLSLISSFLIPQKHFGIFAAFGIFVAMIFSLALIPALLSLLKPPKRKVQEGEGPLSKALSGFKWLVTKHRRATLVVAVLIFIVFVVGSSMIRIETSQTEFLGEDHPVVKGTTVMDDHFSGSNQVIIEVDTKKRDGLKEPALLKKIVKLEEWLTNKSGVRIKKTASITSLVRQMNQKFHAGDPQYYRIPDDRKLVSQLLLLFTFQGGDLGSMALGDFSAGEVIGFYPTGGSSKTVQLKNEVQDYLDGNFSDIRVEMVGSTRVGASMFSRLVTSQIISLVVAILAAGFIVTLLMRSLVAGLISLIPLVMTVVVNFGVMGFSNTPLDMATLMISSIVIGIGIDYAIHFISRFREEYYLNQNSEKALSTTLQTTGRGITFNAMALALGFGVLLFSNFKGMVNFGMLIAMTMIISAASAFTIIPAILITWKPKFLKKKAWSKKGLLSKIGISQPATEQANPNSKSQEVKHDKS